MVYCFCHCMFLHVFTGDLFLFWIAVWPFFWEKKLFFWLSACNCGCAVALSSFLFPFGVLGGRC